MKFVVRGVPFHCTAELLTKPEPLTVSQKSEPLAVALPGERLVIVGRKGPADWRSMTLERICPLMLPAAIRSVVESRFCLVEVMLLAFTLMKRQAGPNDGLSMLV